MRALAILISAGAALVSSPSIAQSSAPETAPGVTWQQAATPSTTVPAVSDAENAPFGREFQRLQRGGQVPQSWFSPRFIVANWALYGFPPPYPGLAWVRYYEDALLIDRNGWVHDSRHEVDWARYGESWRTDRGVPEYALESESAVASHAYPDPANGLGYGYGLFYVPITITETTTVRGAPPKSNGPEARPGT